MLVGSTYRGPVLELSREDGHAIPTWDANRRRDGLVDVNQLSPEEALRLSRAIRAKALKPILPDSTPLIREERNRR